MSADWLPLFPLQVVLLPGMSLPLHIFEPRYRLMIRTCIDRKEEFGVVLAQGKGMAETGCSAQIVRITREFSDGRLNILTIGRRRFRIGRVSDELPYLRGEVEFLPEEEPEAFVAEPPELMRLWPEAYRLATGEQRAPERTPAFTALSYFIAATLPLDVETRQAVLQAGSESARLGILEDRLGEWLPRLRRVTHLKEKAAGNGHG